MYWLIIGASVITGSMGPAFPYCTREECEKAADTHPGMAHTCIYTNIGPIKCTSVDPVQSLPY